MTSARRADNVHAFISAFPWREHTESREQAIASMISDVLFWAQSRGLDTHAILEAVVADAAEAGISRAPVARGCFPHRPAPDHQQSSGLTGAEERRHAEPQH